MYQFSDPSIARVLVQVIDCALKGSEYAVEAWRIMRRNIVLGRGSIPLDDFERVADLLDRALDDVEGPGLRVDLSRDRIYDLVAEEKEERT